jgi:hypothetical protein
MSIRAYRINKIEMEKDHSFNFSQNYYEISPFVDYETEGEIEFEVEKLKDLLESKELDEYTKERIKEDIKWAEDKGDNFISYKTY